MERSDSRSKEILFLKALLIVPVCTFLFVCKFYSVLQVWRIREIVVLIISVQEFVSISF